MDDPRALRSGDARASWRRDGGIRQAGSVSERILYLLEGRRAWPADGLGRSVTSQGDTPATSAGRDSEAAASGGEKGHPEGAAWFWRTGGIRRWQIPSVVGPGELSNV